MELIGARIRRLREATGKKQKDVAKELGVQPNTLCNYENGRTPDFTWLKQIAEHYKVSLDYLGGYLECPIDPLDPTYQQLVSIYASLSPEKRKEMIKEMRCKYAER